MWFSHLHPPCDDFLRFSLKYLKVALYFVILEGSDEELFLLRIDVQATAKFLTILLIDLSLKDTARFFIQLPV
jgi:hypothetical protein